MACLRLGVEFAPAVVNFRKERGQLKPVAGTECSPLLWLFVAVVVLVLLVFVSVFVGCCCGFPFLMVHFYWVVSHTNHYDYH